MADDDPVPVPNRKMRRDMGITQQRIFSHGKERFGQILNTDDVGIDTYKTMMRDGQVRSGIEVITLATIGSGWEFNFPFSEDPKKGDEILWFIRSAFGNINKEDAVNSDMFRVLSDMLTCLWAGFSVTEKVWGQDSEGRWVIKRYKTLPPESVTFNMDKKGRLKKEAAVIQNRYNRDNVKLPARKVNIMCMNSRFGDPYGESILKPVYKNWYIKDWLLKFHSQFLENLGAPMLVGKTNRDTQDMNSALQSAKNSAVITLGDGEEVDMLESTKDGTSFENAIRYHDAQIMKGMLVPSLLVGQDESMGSRALSEVHYEMFKLSRIGALQQQLRTTINKDIREMVRLNFGDFDMYPEITFKSWSRSDQQRLSKMITELVASGVLGPSERWIRQFLELPEPDEFYDPKVFPDVSTNLPKGDPLPGDRVVDPTTVRSPGDESNNPESLHQLDKGPMEQYVFVDKDMAIQKSIEIGFEGRVHKSILGDGTVVWTPGTEEEFFEWYDGTELETYQPPAGAKNNAAKALRWKKEHGSEVKAMTPTGWARARQLASGKPVSRRTVARMAAFNRHRKNAKVDPKYSSEPWKDNGYVAWLGWGGTTGINWAISKMKSIRNNEQVGEIDGMPVYDTIEEAEEKAKEMGCSGYHEHELNGVIVYMPCANHDEITELEVIPLNRLSESEYEPINHRKNKSEVMPQLYAIAERGGRAITKTEAELLGKREVILSQEESKSVRTYWLGF